MNNGNLNSKSSTNNMLPLLNNNNDKIKNIKNENEKYILNKTNNSNSKDKLISFRLSQSNKFLNEDSNRNVKISNIKIKNISNNNKKDGCKTSNNHSITNKILFSTVKYEIDISSIKSEKQKNKKIENEKEKEKRKLSIIDIPYLSSNHEKKKEKEKIEKNEKIKLFKNKKEKFIFILSKSNVVPLKLRIKFCKLNSLVYKNNPPNEIINDYYNLLENKINDLKNKLNQKFYPSFTVQTELNFILKEDENYFFKSFFSNDQIILNYLKCFLIIINNNYILDNKNINCKDLINEIHKISKGNIKKLLINNELINKINEFSESKLNQFIQIYSLIKYDILKKDLPSFLKKILLFIQEIYFFLNDKNNIKIRYNNFTNEQKKLKQKQFLSKIHS